MCDDSRTRSKDVAPVGGTVWKFVSCTHCQERYAYLLKMEATAECHDLLFLDVEGSAQRAREQAEQNLLQKSRNNMLPEGGSVDQLASDRRGSDRAAFFHSLVIRHFLLLGADTYSGDSGAGRVVLWICDCVPLRPECRRSRAEKGARPKVRRVGCATGRIAR